MSQRDTHANPSTLSACRAAAEAASARRRPSREGGSPIHTGSEDLLQSFAARRGSPSSAAGPALYPVNCTRCVGPAQGRRHQGRADAAGRAIRLPQRDDHRGQHRRRPGRRRRQGRQGPWRDARDSRQRPVRPSIVAPSGSSWPVQRSPEELHPAPDVERENGRSRSSASLRDTSSRHRDPDRCPVPACPGR